MAGNQILRASKHLPTDDQLTKLTTCMHFNAVDRKSSQLLRFELTESGSNLQVTRSDPTTVSAVDSQIPACFHP